MGLEDMILDLPYMETLRDRNAWAFMSLHPPASRCPTMAHSQWLTGTRMEKSKGFPGGPVVKTLSFRAVGVGLIPVQRTKIPYGIPLLVCFFSSSALLSLLPACFLLGTPIFLISHSHMNLQLRVCFWGKDKHLRMHYWGCFCRE